MELLQVAYKLRKAQNVPEPAESPASKRVGQRKRLRRHKHWLQINRIDGRGACLSVRVMNQIILLKQETPSATIHCEFCGGAMRLIGSEPHPVKDNADLLTYLCSTCGEFSVLPIESLPST